MIIADLRQVIFLKAGYIMPLKRKKTILYSCHQCAEGKLIICFLLPRKGAIIKH